MAYTEVSNVIVPVDYGDYEAVLTETKSALAQSGAIQRNPEMDTKLAGGALLFHMPAWTDLDDSDANVSAGTAGSPITPTAITTLDEQAVRLARNRSWGRVDLAAILAGSDPMRFVADRFTSYWERELQRAFIASWTGVFADNTANDAADYTVDIKAAAYTAGVTDFNASAFIDAAFTAGDSADLITIVCVHSTVYARMLKNNLIDFVQDSSNALASSIPTFLGRRIVKFDGMPKSGAIYESWLFGEGSTQWGVTSSAPGHVPIEGYRLPLDANGGGSDALVSRVIWSLHPRGHKYAGTSPSGGPSNAATANNLGAAASWDRVAPSRKHVRAARLITREA